MNPFKQKQTKKEVDGIQTSTYFDHLFTATVSTLVDGRRLYYSEPLIEFEPRLQTYSALVFKINQIITTDTLERLIEAENLSNEARNRMSPTRYVDQFKDAIKHNSWTHQEKFSNRINYKWPASPFESWLEESFPRHWMTMQYYQNGDQNKGYVRYDNFASMINVYVPVYDLETFKQEYGEAFVLTKMMYC